VRNIPKTPLLGKIGLRDETKTTSKPTKPTKIRSAAKSKEEEYRRATFMTTQLYPQMRTSAVRERVAAFCEDRSLDTGVLFMSGRNPSEGAGEKFSTATFAWVKILFQIATSLLDGPL
jgi:hypothetical protein